LGAILRAGGPVTGYWQGIWGRLRRDRAALAAIVFLGALIVGASLAPTLAPYEPLTVDFDHLREPPNANHWLGADKQGRDVLSRLLFGARISLAVGFLSQAPVMVIGVALGCAAGYYGGRLDALLMRVVDLFFAFPTGLFLIILMTVMARSFGDLLVALTLTSWAGVARLVRGQVLQLKQAEFVTAAASVGASDAQILLRHILPNLAGILVVALSFGIPGAMVAEAGLSFLGSGCCRPRRAGASCSAMGSGSCAARLHLTLFPGLAIGLTMLALFLLGDGLRDAVDPGCA